jgi:prolyl oligopeptidase
LDADFTGIFKKQVILKLKSDYKLNGKVFKQGVVLIGSLDKLINDKADFKVLIEPSDRMSVSSVQTTKNHILITVLDNVVSKLYKYSQEKSGEWKRSEIIIKPNGTLSVFNTSEKNDNFFVNFTNFLTPSSLYMVSGESCKKELLKSAPKWFDSTPYDVKQNTATSKDGTKIPYFIVKRKDTKYDSNNPTLLYGYGGFLISLKPSYSASIGNAWLSKGGVYVLANIRGGGEFGPKWHQAALKKNRLKAYEDFIAVAKDLIKRKITSPKKLGIQGGSNGGLLVGATFVLRPDLFNAVVCQVPLLDMKRYTKLLAGASWAAEYGDPDKPDMWNYIKKYSPYHNVKKGVKYPEVFFTTSTRDDRVHPGHARKMVARMIGQGHRVFYYENIEGGHGGAANNKQKAYMSALAYSYLYKKLMNK